MVRLGKRNRKFFGSKNHGKGNAKNKRGKGNRGGWGRAGTGKHRWTYITSKEPDFARYGGKMGFTNPAHKSYKTINLYEIQNMLNGGKLPAKDGKPTLEFDGKILGSGMLSAAVSVKARGASEKAIERIKASGGSFEQIKGGKGEEKPA